jgi:hypothetical protein
MQYIYDGQKGIKESLNTHTEAHLNRLHKTNL